MEWQRLRPQRGDFFFSIGSPLNWPPWWVPLFSTNQARKIFLCWGPNSSLGEKINGGGEVNGESNRGKVNGVWRVGSQKTTESPKALCRMIRHEFALSLFGGLEVGLDVRFGTFPIWFQRELGFQSPTHQSKPSREGKRGRGPAVSQRGQGEWEKGGKGKSKNQKTCGLKTNSGGGGGGAKRGKLCSMLGLRL